MKKTGKAVVALLNIIMLVLALIWFIDSKDYEPLIVVIGQGICLLGIAFEGQLSSISLQKIKNSEMDIKSRSEGAITAKNIKKSKIKIDK